MSKKRLVFPAVEVVGGRLLVATPYAPRIPKRMRELGGTWDEAEGLWVLPPERYAEAAETVRQVFRVEPLTEIAESRDLERRLVERRDRIDELARAAQASDSRRESARLRSEIEELAEGCPHYFVSGREDVESAHCEVCRGSLGWRCGVSPDGVCHYEWDLDEDGEGHFVATGKGDIRAAEFRQIMSRRGAGVERLDGDDDLGRVVSERGYLHDSCIFCGHPQERK